MQNLSNSGLKWGLKQGDKVIVPPVYRNLQTPVGNYCAFEGNPRQWGVIHAGWQGRS